MLPPLPMFIGRNWFKQCQGGIKEKTKSALKGKQSSSAVQRGGRNSGGDGGESSGSSDGAGRNGAGDSDSGVAREWSWESVWDGSDSSVAALHHACRDMSEDGNLSQAIYPTT